MSDLNFIINELINMRDEISKAKNENFKLINAVVSMHQFYRVNKIYEISDKLREMLNELGIKIIQGTAGYEYDKIPNQLKGRQVNDIWIRD
jgi:cysteinyl-tRNA synthetase